MICVYIHVCIFLQLKSIGAPHWVKEKKHYCFVITLVTSLNFSNCVKYAALSDCQQSRQNSIEGAHTNAWAAVFQQSCQIQICSYGWCSCPDVSSQGEQRYMMNNDERLKAWCEWWNGSLGPMIPESEELKSNMGHLIKDTRFLFDC